MSTLYRDIESCRLDRGTGIDQLFCLGSLKPTGIFPRPEDEALLPSGPLTLVRGRESGLVQLREEYDRHMMYGDEYGYVSSLNSSMKDHLIDLVNATIRLHKGKSVLQVLDIGSNDGTLLSGYPEHVIKVGCDPIAGNYINRYPTNTTLVTDFFPSQGISDYTRLNGPFDIISSIAMFYDLPDPNDFISGIKQSLHRDGIWTFEQSYLYSMIENKAYDSICHEHVEYYSLTVIKKLLDDHRMKIVDLSLNSVNGGSIRVSCVHANSNLYEECSGTLRWLLNYEVRAESEFKLIFAEFYNSIVQHTSLLKNLVRSLRSEGKVIHGYGASTKGNVILQLCQFGPEDIPYIIDVNPIKHGRVTPGSRIPIVSPDDDSIPVADFYLVLPWHFKENILRNERNRRLRESKFIFPLPAIEIY